MDVSAPPTNISARKLATLFGAFGARNDVGSTNLSDSSDPYAPELLYDAAGVLSIGKTTYSCYLGVTYVPSRRTTNDNRPMKMDANNRRPHSMTDRGRKAIRQDAIYPIQQGRDGYPAIPAPVFTSTIASLGAGRYYRVSVTFFKPRGMSGS